MLEPIITAAVLTNGHTIPRSEFSSLPRYSAFVSRVIVLDGNGKPSYSWGKSWQNSEGHTVRIGAGAYGVAYNWVKQGE